MVEITGVNIAIGGGEVDQGSIFLSFQVNIAHSGGLLQNILWRVVVFNNVLLHSLNFNFIYLSY